MTWDIIQIAVPSGNAVVQRRRGHRKRGHRTHVQRFVEPHSVTAQRRQHSQWQIQLPGVDQISTQHPRHGLSQRHHSRYLNFMMTDYYILLLQFI